MSEALVVVDPGEAWVVLWPLRDDDVDVAWVVEAGCSVTSSTLSSTPSTISPSFSPGRSASVTPRKTAFALSLLSTLFACLSLRFRSRFSSLLSISSTPSMPSSCTPIPDPTHHHHPKKLCHMMTAQISPGNQSYCCLLGMYTKVNTVDANAKNIAPAPNAAVPPSVLHAWSRFTKKPQITRERVNSRERVALQTFCTASAQSTTRGSEWIGRSCIMAATTAKGPRRPRINRFSRVEG